jgi:thiosulfate dehydrogenase
MMAVQFFVVLFWLSRNQGSHPGTDAEKDGDRLMKKVLLGFVLALVVVLLGALAYFGLGLAPVATSAPPMPFERLVAGMALHARISKEAPSQAPIPADEPNLLAGARIYREQCAVCHGLSGQPETAIAKGMFPHPPQLFTGHGVTDDPPARPIGKRPTAFA